MSGSDSDVPSHHGLAGSVRSGTRMVSVSQASLQIVRMLVAILLARLLEPRDFGIVAMAYVVVEFIDIFKDFGTKAAVVQRRTFDPRFASSVFVVNITMGAGLMLLIIASAPLVASLYGEPDVRPVLQVLGLVVAVSSLGMVHQAHMHRNLQFGRIAILNVAIALTNATVSISLALAGFGVWSLVFGTLAGSVVTNLLAWRLSDLALVRHFSWDHVREIRSFSLNLSGSALFGFGIKNADKIIIGRWLGPTSLGHYNIAQRILMYPVRSVTHVVVEVLFPAMSRIQDDNAAIGRGYIRAISGIAMITFPAMTGVALVAAPFVRGILGSGWEPAIAVIVLVAPVGAIQSVMHSASILYTVKDRNDWLLRWTIASGTASVLAYTVGLRWGIVGVAAAFATVHVLMFYPAFAIPFRLIDLRFSVLLRALVPYVVGSAVMAAAVVAAQMMLRVRAAPDVPLMIASILTGVSAYAVVMAIWRPPALAELFALLGIGRRLRR